jgi:hypothetical protein
MTASDLTAYQANVFLILNDGRAGQRFGDEAALELIAKHSAMIGDRERRRFEPFATARAIIEAEVIARDDALCDEIDAVIERTALECATCPECQERFVPVVNEVHVCDEAEPLKEIFGDGITRNDAPQDRILSEGLNEKATRLTRQMLRAMKESGVECEGCHMDMALSGAFRCLECKFWFHPGCLQRHFAAEKPYELSRYERALIFALRAHGDQKRKYTNEPYLIHPIAVAGMLKDAGLDEDAQIAGLFHDLVEDTDVTFEEIESEFGLRVCGLVREVTDFSKPSDGNRANRKRIDREHLATACDDAQSLKCADLISNTVSIVEHDPRFAKIYLAEKRELLGVLTRADRNLLRRACEVLESGERKMF